MATLRLFIAIEIPSGIQSHIADIVRLLKRADADVRCEQPEKLHITLKFLGKTEEGKQTEIVAALEGIAGSTPQFAVRYSTLGCFPHKREPRIIWVGVEDSDSAAQNLAASVESSMCLLGFEKDEKKFHPHVTVGRVRSQRNMNHLIRTMESITFESQPTTISDIALVKSERMPSGSVYKIVKTIPLHQY